MRNWQNGQKDLSKMRIGLVCACLFSLNVSAQEARDCSQIENARERLACFDNQFPSESRRAYEANKAKGPTLQETPIQPSVAPAPAATETPASQPVPTAPPANPAADQTGNADDAPIFSTEKKGGGLFDSRKKIDFASTIVAVKNENKRKMVFRLENDQIWIQVSPRDLPIKVGDKITIKSAIAGGYILRNEGGTSTRVRRIQ